MWLNGKQVNLTTSKLVETDDKSIKAIPYAPKIRCFVNRQVNPYRKHYLPPHSSQIVKVKLPDDVEHTKIMLESLNSKYINFVDQTVSVFKAQVPNGREDSYKFAYLEVVNTSRKGITLSTKKPIAIASEYESVPKAEFTMAINSIALSDPDYNNSGRLDKLEGMLDGKLPDNPQQEPFMKEIIKDFPQVFHLDGEKLSVTEYIQHHINYDGAPLWHHQSQVTWIINNLR